MTRVQVAVLLMLMLLPLGGLLYGTVVRAAPRTPVTIAYA
jgi:hypothetical protein